MAKSGARTENIRIIGGKLRSRQIQAPVGDHTRPTASRTRESLFDLLITRYFAQGLEGLHVADLFSGSGALGIEALSRGAKHVEFFERNAQAINTLRHNLESMGVADCATVHTLDLAKDTPRLHMPPHLLLCDPPYAHDATEMLQNVAVQVRDQAILCYEHAQSARPVLQPPWRLRTRRTWGTATVSIFQKIA